MVFNSIIKLSFTFLLIFFIISCTRYEAKKESLVSNIELVNDLFIKREWSAIYEMRVDAWTHGIGNEEGSQKDFENRANEVYMYTYFSVKTLGFDVKNDSAQVKKFITGRVLLPPFKSYEYITYDYWIYKINKWYLSKWDVPEYYNSEPLDTSYVPLVTDSALQYLVDSIMQRIEKNKEN